MDLQDALNQLSGRVIGAAMEVHRRLGPSFAESVYESALALEFSASGIAYERQVARTIRYRGQDVGEGRIDFLVEDSLIVELKAAEVLLPVHVKQVLGYLRLFRRPLALLLNFHVPLLRDGVRRIIRSDEE